MSIAIFVSLVINTLSYALIVLISYRHKSFKPITTLLGASVLVDILKRIINQPRPDGATRCDAFAMKCEASPYGMPSGHVATAVVASLLVCKELHLSKTATKLITLGVFLLILSGVLLLSMTSYLFTWKIESFAIISTANCKKYCSVFTLLKILINCLF